MDWEKINKFSLHETNDLETKNQVWDGTFNICHNVEGVYLLHIINAWYFHCNNI